MLKVDEVEKILSIQNKKGRVLSKEIINLLNRRPDDEELWSVLPCNKNDIVYLNMSYIENGKLKEMIVEAKVIRCYLGKFEVRLLVKTMGKCSQEVKRNLSDFGKYIFTTREEAEKHIKSDFKRRKIV